MVIKLKNKSKNKVRLIEDMLKADNRLTSLDCIFIINKYWKTDYTIKNGSIIQTESIEGEGSHEDRLRVALAYAHLEIL